jgi:hypothetical protein
VLRRPEGQFVRKDSNSSFRTNYEFGSLHIHTTCEERGLQNFRSLIAWLDSCGRQNKNKYLMSFWYLIMHVKKAFESVEHNFPALSYTYLVCVRDFGVLEWKTVKTLLYMVQNPGLTLLNWRNRRTLSRQSEWCKKNTLCQ